MPDFGTFPSNCIEDILCVFSDVFVNVRRNSNNAAETVQAFDKKNGEISYCLSLLLNNPKFTRNFPKRNAGQSFIKKNCPKTNSIR